MTQLQERKPATTTDVAAPAKETESGPSGRFYAVAIAATAITAAALALALGSSGGNGTQTSTADPQGEVSIVNDVTDGANNPRIYHLPRVAATTSDVRPDLWEELFWDRQASGASMTAEPAADPYEEFFWSRQNGGASSAGEPMADPYEEQFWAGAQD